jgi:hypothetical protein
LQPSLRSGMLDIPPNSGPQSTAIQSHIFYRCILATYPQASLANCPAAVFALGVPTLAFP